MTKDSAITLPPFSDAVKAAKRHREALDREAALRRALRSTLRDFVGKVDAKRASAILEGLAAEVHKNGALP